jgi:carbon monoxide dehydrogenase subunit G
VATVERTADLRHPPHAVWAVLADFGEISGWAPNVDHSCLMSEQTSGVGASRRIQTGRTTLVETVTEWEPGSRLSYAISGLPVVIRSVTNTWHLEPAGEATKVQLTSEIDTGPRPPQQLVARVVARVLGSASDKMLGGLARYLDAPRSADTGASS